MTENMNNNKDQTQEMNEEKETSQTDQTDSQEKKNQEEDKNVNVEEAESSKTEAQLTELQKKYDTLNDKYLRLYSEFENYRRRTAKEKLDSLSAGRADIVKELLPVVDDFERAQTNNAFVEDPETLKEGFELIHNKLMRILQQQGLTPMDSLEKAFDTEYHEAITNIPAPSDELKGKVVDVAEKGYFFKDKIIRYAKVIVGQ